jgi:hypothetical protein
MDPKRGNSTALLVLAAALLIVAAFAWVNYVSQGIAYGAIVGLKGREKDLADMGSSALRALGLAVFSVGLAAALASWALIWGDRSIWARLCIGLALAVRPEQNPPAFHTPSRTGRDFLL